MRVRITGFTIFCLLITQVHSADFYVDPEHGDAANDGSSEKPWQSLQSVLDQGLVESRSWNSLPHTGGSKLVMKNPGAPVKAGDTIRLKSGDYGALKIGDMYNSGVITIAALEGHCPAFQSIRLSSGSHWEFKGLHVRANPEPGKKPGALITIASHGFRGLSMMCGLKTAFSHPLTTHPRGPPKIGTGGHTAGSMLRARGSPCAATT